MKPIPQKARVVVGLGQPQTQYDIPTLIIGMNQSSWDFSRETKQTHTIDLRNIGFPLQIVIFAEETQEDCANILNAAQEKLNNLPDLGIKEPTKQ